LYSIENITAANGWAMAAVGASIVFLGLVVLSFVISQMHKILEYWENRGARKSSSIIQPAATESPKSDATVFKEQHLPEVSELSATYGPFIEALDEPFNLAQVFEIAKENDLPHPHLSINRLREAGILVAQEDGTFTWKKE
jgi:hypothetical protein